MEKVMKKKTKICFCALTAVACVGVASAVAVSNNFEVHGKNDGEYSFALNNLNKFTATEIAAKTATRNTSRGNAITWKMADTGVEEPVSEQGATYAFKLTANDNGWIANASPFTDISKITIKPDTDQATFRFDLGSVQELTGYKDDEKPSYVAYRSESLSLKEETSYTFEKTSHYHFFRIQNVGEKDVNLRIAIEYGCNDTHTHTLETVEKVDKNRGTDGVEKHQRCTTCGEIFDMSGNPTSAEALKIANTLHDVAATTGKTDSDYITFNWDISKVLYMDVLVDSDTEGIYIGFMDKNNGWKRTSNIKVKKDGTFSYSDTPSGTTETKDGAYVLGKTTDDYVRVKFDLTKITKEDGFVGVTDIIIYKWKHSAGKIDINPAANIKTTEFTLLDNKAFTAGSASDYDLPTKILKDDGKLFVTLTFTDSTKKDTRFIFREGWGNNCIGRFVIYNDGTKESGQTYPGLTTEVLETNKIKITIDLKTATGEGGYKTGNPSYFNLFQFNKYGSGTGTCSVTFQANDIVY